MTTQAGHRQQIQAQQRVPRASHNQRRSRRGRGRGQNDDLDSRRQQLVCRSLPTQRNQRLVSRRSTINPKAWLTVETDSASESKGPLLPFSADRENRRRRPIMARSVLTTVPASKHCLTPLSPAGSRWLQCWSKELQQGSRLAYFGLTTLLGTRSGHFRSEHTV